jgi:hypothetical protein
VLFFIFVYFISLKKMDIGLYGIFAFSRVGVSMYYLNDFNWLQHVPTSCRTTAPINSSHHFNPHEPCSYCSNPHHQVGNCPSFGQFSNFSYEQMNTNFSSSGFESNSNFYTPY